MDINVTLSIHALQLIEHEIVRAIASHRRLQGSRAETSSVQIPYPDLAKWHETIIATKELLKGTGD